MAPPPLAEVWPPVGFSSFFTLVSDFRQLCSPRYLYLPFALRSLFGIHIQIFLSSISDHRLCISTRLDRMSPCGGSIITPKAIASFALMKLTGLSCWKNRPACSDASIRLSVPFSRALVILGRRELLTVEKVHCYLLYSLSKIILLAKKGHTFTDMVSPVALVTTCLA